MWGADPRSDVLKIHRIPGKPNTPKSILVKLKNNVAKSAVMCKTSVIKTKTNGENWLSDDVTRQNAMLIERLKNIAGLVTHGTSTAACMVN